MENQKNAGGIYLDYNATTPLEEEVISAVTEALKNAWGNPSSSYKAGLQARNVVIQAREEVAAAINSKPSDIVFTSGGTEANNWVIKTAVEVFQRDKIENDDRKPHVVSSTVEHDSVSLPLIHMMEEGDIDVTFVPVNEQSGCITPTDVLAAIQPSTCLVTIMMANNETGTIMPIREICSEVKRLEGSRRPLLHTDAAQTLGKVEVDVQDMDVDYLTLVGHKFYGPRIGALFVRNLEQGEAPLHPLFRGGGQERNYRSGTENTPMIAGLGKAAKISSFRLKENAQQMELTRNYLEKRLLSELGEDVVKFNCSSASRLPNTSSVSFAGKGMEGYKLLKRVQGFSCSTGSACHANTCQPSKVLLNFHIPFDQAANTLRISTGRTTSLADIDIVVEELKSIISEIEN